MAKLVVESPGFYFQHQGKRIVVPNHLISVPDISISDMDARLYESFVGKPKSHIEADLIRVLIEGWKYKAKWYLRYWARKYYEMHPHLREEDGTLRGFKPTELMSYFWPYENEDNAGQRKVHIREELAKWAEKATRDIITAEIAAGMSVTQGSPPTRVQQGGTTPTSDGSD